MSSSSGVLSGFYSSTLALSDNGWLEQLTTDIPFLTIGIVALAAITLLLTTQRLSIPAICIVLSALLAFNGAIFDFARLLQEAKSVTPPQPETPISTTREFPLVVLREVNLALSVSLNFFFFFVYLGRPPRGEARLVEFSPLSSSRRMSPSRWAYWGVTGYILQAILSASIIAVAVLGIIWRLGGKATGPVYKADYLLQGVLALAFLGKICLNIFLSPLTPRWKTARDYLPVISALASRLGIVLASEFCAGFTEAPLGRFLQAIQLYVLIVLIMVSPYYGTNEDEDSIHPVTQPQEKRASSFRGLRFSTNSQWSILNANPGAPARPTMPPPQPPATLPTTEVPKRLSPTKRLSSWLTNRLTPSGPGGAYDLDGQRDRLWNKEMNRSGDLEAPPTPIGIAMGGTDDDGVSPRLDGETSMMASWRDPYSVSNPLATPETASFAIPATPFSTADTDDRSIYATTPMTGSEKIPPVPLPTKLQLMGLPPPPRGQPPLPPTQKTLPLSVKTAMKKDEKQRVSGMGGDEKSQIPTGKFIGQFEVRKEYDSDSDSPIYGINGIIQRKESRMKKEERKRMSAFLEASTVSALERLKREQDELDKSMRGMAAFSPSRTPAFEPNAPGGGDKSPTKLSNASGEQDAMGNSFRPSFNSAPISESVKSDFSLRDFPSPPTSAFRAPASGTPPSVEVMPPIPAITLPLSTKASGSTRKETRAVETASIASSYPSGEIMVEDVQFAMVPPRRPTPSAYYQRRRASFPTIIRDSSTSSVVDAPMRIISTYAESEDDVGAKRVRMSSTGNRLDVTSFIGELTTPGMASPGLRSFLPGRDRGESITSRLSPLPEDTSRQPSVEIVDIRLKSPTFTPAIAITTAGRGSATTIVSNPAPRVPKVSFALAANNPPSSNRLNAMKPASPTNTLPSSPRPSGNINLGVNESPRRQVAFKPVTSSPLASPGTMVPAASPTSDSPTTRRLKATYPGLGVNGAKPIISGPFPLGTGSMREDGPEYQASRRAPQVRTARFL